MMISTVSAVQLVPVLIVFDVVIEAAELLVTVGLTVIAVYIVVDQLTDFVEVNFVAVVDIISLFSAIGSVICLVDLIAQKIAAFILYQKYNILDLVAAAAAVAEYIEVVVELFRTDIVTAFVIAKD